MAPSATETTTIPTRSSVKLTSNAGPYKELAPIGYEKEVEEQGRDGFSAAKVCLTSIPINILADSSPSTKTTSHTGPEMNVTHL
jgi:hypothetical protein